MPGPGEDEPAHQPVTVPPSIDCRCGIVVPEQHQTPLAQPVADVGPCMGDSPFRQFRQPCPSRCRLREGSRPRRTSPWPAESHCPRWICLAACNMPDGVRSRGRCAVHALVLTACTSLALPEAGGRGPAVADWRNPPPRAPRPMAPGCSSPGLTRRRWVGVPAGEPGSVGRLRADAHGATFPSAIESVGTGGVALEHVGTVSATETLDTVGLALPPRDPQERR